MFYWFIRLVAWPLRTVYFRIRAVGLENLPAEGPAIVIANHASFLDAGVLGVMLPRKVHFIVLSSMFSLWRIRWFYVGMETIPIRSGRPDRAAIRQALGILARGGVVGIFPEGSRSPDGRLQQPLPGAAMIALRSGAQVVPAGIRGAYEAFPRGCVLPRPRRIRLRMGRPFRLERGPRGRPAREVLEEQSRRMMEELAALLQDDVGSPAGHSQDTEALG